LCVSQSKTSYIPIRLIKSLQVFREARRTAPSIIYLPHIESWWTSVSETTRATFITLLLDIPSHIPVLFLSTSDVLYQELAEEIQDIFTVSHNEVFMFLHMQQLTENLQLSVTLI